MYVRQGTPICAIVLRANPEVIANTGVLSFRLLYVTLGDGDVILRLAEVIYVHAGSQDQ